MPDLTYRNRSFIKNSDPLVAEALDDILNLLQNTLDQANTAATGTITPPPSVSSIQITAAQGIFDAAIVDNISGVVRGINYFLEYSTSPSFTAPVVIDLGASRNWRGFLGNQVLYWRGYSSYPTSARSEPAYYGTQSQPIAVAGGGTSTGPAPLPSNGSGTSSGANGGDGGFGNQPFRGTSRPITS